MFTAGLKINVLEFQRPSRDARFLLANFKLAKSQAIEINIPWETH